MVHQIFADRRQQLMKQLPPASIALIPSASEVVRSLDTHFPFCQDSNFYYLTGFNEPDAILAITRSAQDTIQSILFCQPLDPIQEQWHGKRTGPLGACQEFGMDLAFATAEFGTQLLEVLPQFQQVYYALGQSTVYDNLLLQTLKKMRTMQRAGKSLPLAIAPLDNIINAMRLIKDKHELHVLQEACTITANAHSKLMQQARQCTHEYQLQAIFLQETMRHGAMQMAYNPIVASGANACILHYSTNTAKIHNNSLVLVDAGAEYQRYATDVTRTFPANGKFSSEQKAIYEIVLEAQTQGIAAVQPGKPWDGVQRIIVEVITAGLIELGLLRGKLAELIAAEAYRPFYMHRSGHWMGLDVHDVGVYQINNAWRNFAPNMVLTVEPGLYISANLPNVDSKWWNIGVRIEDDIVVTTTGNHNLTAAAPRRVADIEELMR